MWLGRGSWGIAGYPCGVSHAGPGAPRTSWGRAAVLVLGIPLGLVALAFAFALWVPSSGPTEAATVDATPVADVTPAVPSTTPDPTTAPPDEPADEPTAEPAATPTGPDSQSPSSATGRSGRSDANRANPALDVVWRVETDDPVFFITVDDNLRDQAVADAALQIVRANQIPITAFLTTNYVGDDGDYFNEVTSFGGSIQNHTVTHPFFNRADSDPYFEICTAQERLAAQFGDTPWMMRPPYGEPYFSGADPSAVEAASANCGVNRIVMWSAVVDNGNVSYNPGTTLQPGDIVLFHFWDPKFAEGLQMILDIGKANGLSPAPLEDYL